MNRKRIEAQVEFTFSPLGSTKEMYEYARRCLGDRIGEEIVKQLGYNVLHLENGGVCLKCDILAEKNWPQGGIPTRIGTIPHPHCSWDKELKAIRLPIIDLLFSPIPLRPTCFFDAVTLAADRGKRLPTLREWLIILYYKDEITGILKDHDYGPFFSDNDFAWAGNNSEGDEIYCAVQGNGLIQRTTPYNRFYAYMVFIQ